MDEGEKVRENRLRRAAVRQGLTLSKSRARDPRALEYDRWHIIDAYTNTIVAGAHPWNYSLTLDEVEDYLASEREEPGAK
jgi:hypothetical protein